MKTWLNIIMSGVVAGLLCGGLAGCKTGGGQPLALPEVQDEVITDAHRALVARAHAVMAAAEGTPGQEFANRLRTDHYVDWLKKLNGDVKARRGELSWPVMAVSNVVLQAEAGLTWPVPPLCRIPRARGAVVIDGKLNDPGWAGAVTYTNIYAYNKRDAGGPGTTWKMMWDETFLYVAFDCMDTDIIAPRRARDADVYTDDCVEIYVMPDFQFRTYWEIDVAPSGDLYDAIQCKRARLWGPDENKAATLEGLRIGTDIRGTLNQTNDTDVGYSVELAIPFDGLPGYSHARPKAGDSLYMMLLRLDRQGKGFVPYAYQPLLGWGHNIWNHGRAELGE